MPGRLRYSHNGNRWSEFRPHRRKLPRGGVSGAVLLGILLAPVGAFYVAYMGLPWILECLMTPGHTEGLRPVWIALAIGAAAGFVGAFFLWEWNAKEDSDGEK